MDSIAAQDQLEVQRVDNDDEDELEEFDTIEKLEQLGVNRGDIKKAKEAGYHTCQALLMHTKKELGAIKGLSDAKVEKMIEGAKKFVPSSGWQSASDYQAQRQRDVAKISTGAKALDNLLTGGFETKSIIEIHGEHRTGKTQICHTLCVTTQMPQDMGGGAGKVAYIDCEGTFRPERIIPIANRFNLDAEAVLGNIVYARAFTHEQQFDLLISIAAKMSEEPFKLLVVDGITSLFRIDFTGRGELADRQQKLNIMLGRLKKLAEEFNVAVVLTNQVMSDPSGGAMFVVDPKKPVGGHILAHACTCRISLRKGKGEQRLAKVVDSPSVAEAEASFCIAHEGISDYAD